MSDFDELDDILISLRERREKLDGNAKSAPEPIEAPVKSRSQRAKEERELQRKEQERLEKERKERERLQREQKKRQEQERLAREKAEKERIEKEREAQLIREMELEAERNRERRREQEEKQRLEKELKEKEEASKQLNSVDNSNILSEPEYEEIDQEIDRVAIDKILRKQELKKRKRVKQAIKNGATPEELEEIKLKIVEESRKKLEPPKPLIKDNKAKKENPVMTLADDENDNLEKLVWIRADGRKVKEKVTKASFKESVKKIPSNIVKSFKNHFIPALKRGIKSSFTKQMAIFLAIILALSGLVYGGNRLYEYSQIAYLKPYQEKYPDVQFPQGILEEMCDEYGQNSTIVGKLEIQDTETNCFSTYQRTQGYVFGQHSRGVTESQQFLAVDINGYGDIEAVYSSPEGYLNSTQTITYTTLFEKNTYKVIAAYYTNLNPEDDRDYAFPYSVYGNLTEKSFKEYEDKIKSRRLYDTGYTLSYTDRFITVSADSDFMNDFKFVIVGVKIDKSKLNKSNVAIPNNNVHYPQIWYDVNNLENTYRWSKKWYPEIYTDSAKEEVTQLTKEDFLPQK